MSLENDEEKDLFKQIATLLGRLVEIEEYRVEMERKALEKDGFTIKPLPPMESMIKISVLDKKLLDAVKTAGEVKDTPPVPDVIECQPLATSGKTVKAKPKKREVADDFIPLKGTDEYVSAPSSEVKPDSGDKH